jgi:hypothetical protein
VQGKCLFGLAHIETVVGARTHRVLLDLSAQTQKGGSQHSAIYRRRIHRREGKFDRERLLTGGGEETQKWEYAHAVYDGHTVEPYLDMNDVSTVEPRPVMRFLEEARKQGWEMCGVIPYPTSEGATSRRPKATIGYICVQHEIRHRRDGSIRFVGAYAVAKISGNTPASLLGSRSPTETSAMTT